MKNPIRASLVVFTLLILSACVSTPDTVWIDVRTVEEFSDDHIAGDMNIPLASIDVDALAERFGKDDEINLYCRSGNRAGQAKEILEAAGFTNVNNVGGISDVRELRSLATQSSLQ